MNENSKELETPMPDAIAQESSLSNTPSSEHVQEAMATTEEEVSQTADDIIKEKRQYNSGDMSVSGNQAENQQFIQTAIFYGSNHFGIHEVARSDLLSTDTAIKEYDLSNANECAAFGAEYGASEHFAYAVILSIFEYVELDDLQNLKAKLLEELPPIIDDEGSAIAAQQNPYLPINDILRVIKGKQFTTDNGERCVGLGNSRSVALNNLWTQFPTLRGNIACWLLAVSDSFVYRTNFDAFQVSSAFINVMKLDFTAGTRHLFPQLHLKPEKYWLLGRIAFALYKDKDYHSKILPFMTNWATSRNNWHWKIACYMYAYIEDSESANFGEQIQQTMERKFASLNASDKRFLLSFERLRTLSAGILNTLIAKAQRCDEKIILALIYTNLLRYGYYTVSPDSPACPLLTCDTKNQLMSIQPLIAELLPRYRSRKMLFSIIGAYLKELSDYAVNEKTVKHLKAYFSVMAENNPRHASDILLFLQRCNCTMANMLIPVVKMKTQPGGKSNG